MEIRQDLLKAILEAERDRANDLISKWARDNSYRKALQELLEPVLRDIGNLWEKEEISLAQGYVAAKIAEDVLNKIIEEEMDVADKQKKGPIVLANIEDDYHSLGRKMVSIFLQADGWEIIDMGNDVLAEEIIDQCEKVNARIVGVSAMMYTTAKNIRKVRDLIDARNLSGHLKLAVGGAIFKLRPDLVKELGGDGTAATAINAPALFDRLWNESLKSEK